jgi:hypothetical protein
MSHLPRDDAAWFAYKMTTLAWGVSSRGEYMTIRTALVGCTLAFATLAAGTAAHAGDPYGGFGPSVPDTPAGNADAANAAAPGIDLTLPWLQPQSQNQQESYSGGGEWYQNRAVQDDGSDVDDASGH